MTVVRRPGAFLVLAALLAGCGDLPRPFAGRPGANGLRLSRPPPARLLVEPAAAALLPDSGVNALAVAVADALVARELPAIPAVGRAGDWRLVTTAELHGTVVVPRFAVQDPQGKPAGEVAGTPVPAPEWQQAAQATLDAVAAQAAPNIAALLNRIEARREESDPDSLMNRPTRVAVIGVTGAPGDGNTALSREIASSLGKRGEDMRGRAEEADYTVQGLVRAVPEGGGLTRIELQWVVRDSQNREAGRVVQVNEVADDAVSGLWGEVAMAAASEAAGGVRDVILRQLESRKAPAGS